MKRMPLLMAIALLFVPAIGLGCKKDSSQEKNAAFVAPKDEVAQGRKDEAAGKQPPVERKIIYTAEVDLAVADVGKAELDLYQLVQAHKGYVSRSEVIGSAGGKRSGSWTLRIPVSRFNDFREAVKKLGDLVRYTSDAKDVTEEYFDLEERIKNKEGELARLRKLYEQGQGKLDEILTVQRELNRAILELDQLKGRHRLLDNLTEMTTITVRLQESGTYLPKETPPFDSTIDKTFSGSWWLLVQVGKAIVLVAVALAPWLPPIALVTLSIWWLRRRSKKAA